MLTIFLFIPAYRFVRLLQLLLLLPAGINDSELISDAVT
jgi:hypothetical protein